MPYKTLPGGLSRLIRPLLPASWRPERTIIPVVRLSGVIATGAPLRQSLSLQGVAGWLDKAFGYKDAPEVAIIVNSPGGSPVQSHLIFRRIRALAEEKGKRVSIVVEDVAASGGYMIACAGDEIIADPSSIIGSIGVVSAGFGFVEAIDKLGIERRVYTTGSEKGLLDPFRPEKPEDVDRLKAVQADIYNHFVALVRERRASVLDTDADALFSGAFWAAPRAKDLGLIDRIGDIRAVMREKYGDRVDLRLVGGEKTPFGRRLFGMAGGAGLSLEGASRDVLATVEERALWSRFGL